ncbi:CGNR zinc finger domain-containing protein [Nocardia wallacei]|uniref:CGNR zinc finger domain-containing protein n=1 Tax=Nocardia wallacei TaxID=480035 RepID=UPI0024564F61|nr:CGNR zinc finger domain-containing protein [Nocardia wallacei]
MRDPRPHVGEPLAVDLLNTRWMSADGPRDLLIDLDGLRCWLTVNDLSDSVPDERTRHALLSTRDAIRRAVCEDAFEELNRILDHGRIRRVLTAAGPAEHPDVPRSEWLAAWLAADNLLRLLAERPGRIKQCAHPQCVLFFYDTSKNGTRRWHSMAACGNRAKAARHYARKS